MATALSNLTFSYTLLWVAVWAWGLAIAFYVLAAFRKGHVLTLVPLLVPPLRPLFYSAQLSIPPACW